MTQPIPAALANTILLAEHDEATQRAVVDAVEKIIVQYLQRNMDTVGTYILSQQQTHLERTALRAIKNHFINASNIY